MIWMYFPNSYDMHVFYPKTMYNNTSLEFLSSKKMASQIYVRQHATLDKMDFENTFK